MAADEQTRIKRFLDSFRMVLGVVGLVMVLVGALVLFLRGALGGVAVALLGVLLIGLCLVGENLKLLTLSKRSFSLGGHKPPPVRRTPRPR